MQMLPEKGKIFTKKGSLRSQSLYRAQSHQGLDRRMGKKETCSRAKQGTWRKFRNLQEKKATIPQELEGPGRDWGSLSPEWRCQGLLHRDPAPGQRAGEISRPFSIPYQCLPREWIAIFNQPLSFHHIIMPHLKVDARGGVGSQLEQLMNCRERIWTGDLYEKQELPAARGDPKRPTCPTKF